MVRHKEKKRDPKPLANPLDSAFRDRLMEAARRRKLLDGDDVPLYGDIAKAVDCTRQAIWQYFNVVKERRTIDALLFLRLCDFLSVTPWWLGLGEGSIEDVPVGRRPMDGLRKKAASGIPRQTREPARA